MLTGGVTVQGDYHDINQDSYAVYADKDACAIVVSDGLGSKPFSQDGSAALCRAVTELIKNRFLLNMDAKRICRMVYQKWLQLLDGRKVDECCATALFCFLIQDEVQLFQLGDGLAGVLTATGPMILFDDKSTHFYNETDCLSSIFDSSRWRFLRFPAEEFRGALLCTDGVGIFPDTMEGFKQFTTDFISGYANMEINAITEDIRSWLFDWPGTDDKTIAFMISEEIVQK